MGKNKILVDGAIATRQWRDIVSKVLVYLFVLMPVLLLFVLAGLVWLASLGHITFMSLLGRAYTKAADKVIKID